MDENVNPQNNMDKASGVELKQLRTYEDDVKNIIGDQQISTSNIVMAEQKKRLKQVAAKPKVVQVEQQKKSFNTKPLITGILSILLIAGGGIAIYFAYNYLQGNNEGIVSTTQASYIDVDEVINIDSRNKTLREITGEIRSLIIKQEAGKGGDLIEINIIKDVIRNINGVEEIDRESLISEDFFTLIESDAPESLLRSLNDTLVIGLHKRFKMEPFVVMQSTDLNQSYSGMLSWERTLVREVQDIFFENLGSSQVFTNENIEISTSTPTYIDTPFRDIIISNKDARAILDEDNNILLFYSIIDNENIVITTNKETFDLVLNRLNVAKLTR